MDVLPMPISKKIVTKRVVFDKPKEEIEEMSYYIFGNKKEKASEVGKGMLRKTINCFSKEIL